MRTKFVQRRYRAIYHCRACEGEPYGWSLFVLPDLVELTDDSPACPQCGAAPPTEERLREWLGERECMARDDAMERRAEAKRDV